MTAGTTSGLWFGLIKKQILCFNIEISDLENDFFIRLAWRVVDKLGIGKYHQSYDLGITTDLQTATHNYLKSKFKVLSETLSVKQPSFV